MPGLYLHSMFVHSLVSLKCKMFCTKPGRQASIQADAVACVAVVMAIGPVLPTTTMCF